jgi:hypothetical protein
MKNTVTILLGCIAAVAVAVLLWPTFGSPAQAQSNCKSFDALVHATLPTSTPLAMDDTWGGPLYAILGASLNAGILSGNDGSEIWRGHLGNMGRAAMASTRLDSVVLLAAEHTQPAHPYCPAQTASPTRSRMRSFQGRLVRVD